MTSILTIATALITALIGPIVVELVKNKFKNSKRDILGESIYVNEKVDKQLELLMSELQCDRICISQFHNGGHFYPTGKSIKKFRKREREIKKKDKKQTRFCFFFLFSW